jgi:hypothetical protein
MQTALTPPKRRTLALASALAAIAALVVTVVAGANVALTQIAVDPFLNASSQHKTIVEPDTFSAGTTIVAAGQFGRFNDGGASDIGFATSTNSGSTWSSGVMPGITTYSSPPGPYSRVSDPSVAFDAKHNVWLVSSLALTDPGPNGAAVIVSRSTTGGLSWTNPVTIAAAGSGQDFDKNWSVCDNTATSPFYGSCYTQWDDFGHGNLLKIAYSRDGGLTWTLGKTPRAGIIGGQPVVQPNGSVVVPLDNASETALGYTISTNGGVNFGQALTITSITAFADPGNIRSGPLPSAEIDGAGKVFVVWEDCRFRSDCSANDLVYVTSTNGTTWSAVQRIPIDAVTSSADYFIPGVAVDKSTSGATARVSVAYYFYPNKSCTVATCQLSVGYISSTNGGASWGAATQLAGPMTMSWIPNTTQGRMVGDYISSSYAGGTAHPVFAVANPPTAGGTDCATATPNCDQALYTPASGLAAAGGAAVSSDPVVVTAAPNPGKSAFKHRR